LTIPHLGFAVFAPESLKWFMVSWLSPKEVVQAHCLPQRYALGEL
jgi:hypothetical protein